MLDRPLVVAALRGKQSEASAGARGKRWLRLASGGEHVREQSLCALGLACEPKQ
jgi:hypothetical protein